MLSPGWGNEFMRNLKILMGLIVIVALAGGSVTSAQNGAAFVRQVRAMESDDTGLANPAGLAFSPGANAFHVVEARGQGQPAPSETDIIKLTPFGDQV